MNKVIILIERVTRTKISIKRTKIRDTSKLPKYSSSYLSRIVDIMERVTNINPQNVFEIGANYGQDAEFLKTRFNLEDSAIFVFEPHPEIFAEMKKKYSFNCYPNAISDKNEKVIFHAVSLKSKNSGISSLMKHKYNGNDDYFETEVESLRMDKFIAQNNVNEIDFLKIDVEGGSYEVLCGFGRDLDRVKAIQIESEYAPVWIGQKTWDEIYNLLMNNDFQLIHFELQEDGIQSDSFWINNKFVKHQIYNISTGRWHEESHNITKNSY